MYLLIFIGIFFFLAYSQNINVADGSVILKTDNGKYRDTDDSFSEVESDDESELLRGTYTRALRLTMATIP